MYDGVTSAISPLVRARAPGGGRGWPQDPQSRVSPPTHFAQVLRPVGFPQISLRPPRGCRVPEAFCKAFQKSPETTRPRAQTTHSRGLSRHTPSLGGRCWALARQWERACLVPTDLLDEDQRPGRR